MDILTKTGKKIFYIFTILAITFSEESYSDSCDVKEILKDNKITEVEVDKCPLEKISESIAFNIFTKRYPNRADDYPFFQESLNKVKKDFIFVHFIKPDIVNIVLQTPQKAGNVLNFLELPKATPQPNAQDRQSDKDPKRTRVEVERKMTRLDYIPDPLQDGKISAKLKSIFPKYTRVFNCKSEFYIGFNYGDIGVVISPKIFNRMSITLSGTQKKGIVSGPLGVLPSLLDHNEYKNIFEAHIWGKFNLKEDIIAVLIPSKDSKGGDYLSSIKEPFTLDFINNFKRINKILYYDLKKLNTPVTFGDYEYDKKGTINFNLTKIPKNINLCDSIYTPSVQNLEE
jgi:hypothetical protein